MFCSFEQTALDTVSDPQRTWMRGYEVWKEAWSLLGGHGCGAGGYREDKEKWKGRGLQAQDSALVASADVAV